MDRGAFAYWWKQLDKSCIPSVSTEDWPSYPETDFEMSPSRIQDYLRCPFSFSLRQQGKKPQYGDSTEGSMRMGQFIEAYILGCAESSKEAGYMKSNMWPGTENQKKQNLRDVVFGFHDQYPGVFSSECVSKVRYFNRICEGVHEKGEMDVIGPGRTYIAPGKVREELEAIWDIKGTDNMQRVWKDPQHKKLQATAYSAHAYRTTGKIYPFIFVIVDTRYGKQCAVRFRKLDITEKAIDQYNDLLEKLPTMDEFKQTIGLRSCLGMYEDAKTGERRQIRGEGACPYLQFCELGRTLMVHEDDIVIESIL